MKKIVLFTLLLVSSIVASSQIKFKPGVRAGANFSKITNVDDAKTRTGLYLGALLGIEFSTFYTLQPEVNYSQQGTKFDLAGVDDLELDYLTVNVINKFTPLKGVGAHLLIGPGLNFKVGDNIEEDLASDSLEGFDFTLIAGFGYDFPFGLSVETRYNIGIVDIFGSNVNDTDGDGSDVRDVRLNSTVQLGLVYKFDF